VICRILFSASLAVTLAAQQFEVASVKLAPNPPGPQLAMAMAAMGGMMPSAIAMPDSGRVRMKNMTLRALIAAAYRLRADRVTGPSWMDDNFFDVEATMPAGADKDQAHEMLQNLLIERFGLAFHRETKELSGYALSVGKNGPKLQESAPPPPVDESLTPEERRNKMMAQIQERMRNNNGPRIAGGQSWHFGSTTTAQLADRLTGIVRGPVVDETGLTGKYSIDILTHPATDDLPEQTIYSELERMGLKLTSRKISAEFLIVDKISKLPTEN
jgi:uncharacterized protein (TIGR03435 family)